MPKGFRRVAPKNFERPVMSLKLYNRETCLMDLQDKDDIMARMLERSGSGVDMDALLTKLLSQEERRDSKKAVSDLPPAELRGYRFEKPKVALSTLQHEREQALYDRLMFEKSGHAARKAKSDSASPEATPTLKAYEVYYQPGQQIVVPAGHRLVLKYGTDSFTPLSAVDILREYRRHDETGILARAQTALTESLSCPGWSTTMFDPKRVPDDIYDACLEGTCEPWPPAPAPLLKRS